MDDRHESPLRRVIRGAESLLLGIAGVALVTMMLVVTGNAIGRYLFDRPLPGVINVTELYLMMAIVFFTLPHLQRKEGNIAVDVLATNLSGATREVVTLVSRLVTLGIFAFITYLALDTAVHRLSIGATTAGLIQWPTYLSWSIMAIGLLIFCVRLLVQTIASSNRVVEIVRASS